MNRIAACCRRILAAGGALTIVLVFGGAVNAEYMQPDVEKIPLKRVIENLKEKLQAAPKDATLLGHLARAYGMAFAAGLNDESPVERQKQRDGLWFGYEPAYVPFAGRLRGKPEERSKAYLEQAIDCYRKALEIEPKNLTNMLGLAWCIEQSGKKDEALKLYRELIAASWQKDGQRSSAGLGTFVTVEAAGYLNRLLDPKADEKEIADLDAKVKHLESLPRAITPVAIPLQDGLNRTDMIDPKGVVFDLDGTGRRLRWQWIKTNAAWLVYDYDDSGRITSAVQMFGSRTFMLFLQDGYAAMSLLDDDGNGSLEGRELEHLALWQDLNGNGVSEPGEVKPLSVWKIKVLSCRAETGTDGGWFSAKGVTFEDGSTRPTYDLVQKPAG